MAPASSSPLLFDYTGFDSDGERVKGRAEGESVAGVRVHLRKQGIRPTSVRPYQPITLFAAHERKVKAADIAIISRQLATMLGSGIPLVQALDVIARGVDKKKLAKLLDNIRGEIESGQTLAAALAAHPRHFDELYVNLVAAGEESGSLESLLHRIATYREKTEAIKAKVRKTMYYPSAIIAVAMVVTGILLYFVVPQFRSLFDSFGARLPAFTRLVIELSHAVQNYWYLILIGFATAIMAVTNAHKHFYGFRYRTDWLLIKTPLIGPILYKAAVARFARTLSTLFAAGVPLVDALDSVARAAGNLVFETSIQQLRRQVATGQRLQRAMNETRMFPNMAVQMIAIGEEAGSLDGMCARVADFYEEEVDNKVDSLSSLLEPLITVMIGVIVGGIVVAMYLPIFQLGSAI
ncbi:type II secretion system F family protein [Salinisphaera orenii]|uniref:type II secretion system F family protein n=1 Tax=Salinisphaera orenii TaxID=856731 RepID=UPI000DBE75B2